MKRKHHLPPKMVSLFLIYGTIYICMEVLWRACSGYAGDKGMELLSTLFKRPALIGYTSMWMFIIGAISGLVLGGINEVRWIKNSINHFWQAVIGALAVLSVEFVSGVVCNIWLKFGFAFWFDDFARWCLYDEVTELKPLWKVYLECLLFWKKR